ncbi:MAG: hypothetical protein ACYS8Z_05165 [Planctomycetota bacterium]|jgi:hypothetical protein
MIRLQIIAVLGSFFVFLPGCNEPQDSKVWDEVKIGDLRTLETEKLPGTENLRTANFDVHIYELPAENVPKLEDFWAGLRTRGLTFYNYRAFAKNLFRIGTGKGFAWSGIDKVLEETGGRKMAKISAFLTDEQAQDLQITGLDRPLQISFVDRDQTRDEVLMGPGLVNLRLIAQQVPGIRGASQLIGYPSFTLPTASAQGPVGDFAKQQEVEFKAAGFGLKMSPDEYLVLGPQKYISERATLAALFFTNLNGTLFAERGKRPARKVSVRLFVIVCTTINY